MSTCKKAERIGRSLGNLLQFKEGSLDMNNKLSAILKRFPPFLSSAIFSSDNNISSSRKCSRAEHGSHVYVPGAKAPQPPPNKLQIACGGKSAKSAKEHVFGEQRYKVLEIKVYVRGLL